MDLPLLKKVIAAVQATTNDQVVKQQWEEVFLCIYLKKITKSQYYLSSYQIMITISMLKTKIFAFKTYLTGSKLWDH
jgi:hypothetical protein